MRTDFHRGDGPAGTRAGARYRHCRERRRPDKLLPIPEPVGRLSRTIWKGCVRGVTRASGQVFSVRLLSSGSIPVDHQGTRLGTGHHHLHHYADDPPSDLQKEIDAAPTAIETKSGATCWQSHQPLTCWGSMTDLLQSTKTGTSFVWRSPVPETQETDSGSASLRASPMTTSS